MTDFQTEISSLTQLSTSLQDARIANNMTQTELATATGIPRPWINQLEHGHIANPSFTRILKIMAALNPNPYTSTTVTPDSKTKVKTYGFVFKKTDPDGNALKGAVFELKVTNKDGSTTTLTSTSDENGYVYFEDLGEGTYTVTETVVPAGFSKVADQTFTDETR